MPNCLLVRQRADRRNDGLGDSNHGLIDKWRDVADHALPLAPPTDCDPCVKNYFDSAGDGRRQQMAAAWLVQSSKAARLHASIANSIYTHLAVTHEGMHDTYVDNSRGNLDFTQWNSDHQIPFNEAAEKLLGISNH